MNAFIRFVSTVTTLATLSLPTACMRQEPVDVSHYPDMDEDVESLVTKEEATDVAEIALGGFNTGDFDAWTTQWHSSLTDAIEKSAWLEFRAPLMQDFGPSISVIETRLTAADTEGFVRFSFLVEHERGELILVHVYPNDGDEIVGAFMAEPAADEG